MYFSNSQPSRDLPDPGRPRHQHHPRHPPLRRSVEQLLDGAQLGVPADQRGLQPIDPLHAAYPGQHPHRPPQMLRLGLALQRMLPGIGEPDPAARQPLRRPIGQHRTRLRRRLHPGRGVHRIPGHHPLAGGPQGDRHLTGHHPRPRRQVRHTALRTQFTHAGYELQRGAHRPLRVPLRGDRRSPHRHHRVADELLHHPPIAADHRPRPLEVRRQQLPHRFRVPRLRQRREPDHVAEQHRAHPPLRHRLPARRRLRARGGRRGSGQRMPAGTAEGLSRRDRLTT